MVGFINTIYAASRCLNTLLKAPTVHNVNKRFVYIFNRIFVKNDILTGYLVTDHKPEFQYRKSLKFRQCLISGGSSLSLTEETVDHL